MADLPSPPTTSHASPTPIDDDGVQLGVLVNTQSSVGVTAKATITDTFTDLDDWVTILGEPQIVSGDRLGGEGVIRHKTQALTDSHKVTGTVADAAFGRTRLYCCASADLKTYYGVEIEHDTLLDDVHFIAGTPESSVEAATGLLGVIESALALLYGLLSIFSIYITPKGTATSVTVFSADEISVWYDEPNSTVRCYKNGNQILAVPRPRGEIPHGPGYRHHGVSVGLQFGLGFLGARFGSYECVDV